MVWGSWERRGAGGGVTLAWFAAFSVSISLKRELLPQLRAVLRCCFGYVVQFTFIYIGSLTQPLGNLFGPGFLSELSAARDRSA